MDNTTINLENKYWLTKEYENSTPRYMTNNKEADNPIHQRDKEQNLKTLS